MGAAAIHREYLLQLREQQIVIDQLRADLAETTLVAETAVDLLLRERGYALAPDSPLLQLRRLRPRPCTTHPS